MPASNNSSQRNHVSCLSINTPPDEQLPSKRDTMPLTDSQACTCGGRSQNTYSSVMKASRISNCYKLFPSSEPVIDHEDIKEHSMPDTPIRVDKELQSDSIPNIFQKDSTGCPSTICHLANIAEVTVSAPVNIAVIKYWGKRNDSLVLPANSSLSVTLSQDVLHSRTSVRADPSFLNDRLWLNGIEMPISSRISNVLEMLREEARKNSSSEFASRADCFLNIVSENNFPTAAGLASSASGIAALVYGVAELFYLHLDFPSLSRYARLGSGSACRSMMPGFVAWDMGHCDETGIDSGARCVENHEHWPEFEALVVIVSDCQKTRPSTDAMSSSVRSSPLSKYRFENIVPQRMISLEKAVKEKNFDDFAELCMRDSNQFHAICMDSFPPIFYMNEISKLIIQLIHDYNSTPLPSYPGRYKAAYTFDAGPNAVIYTTRPFVHDLITLLEHYFPPKPDSHLDRYFPDKYDVRTTYKKCNNILQAVHTKVPVQAPESVKKILHSRIGDGPRLLARGHSSEISLVNRNGYPRRVRD